MTRIEQEKDTIFQMIKIYCHGNKHCHAGLCDDCSALLDYAYARLEHCKFGEKKPTCKKCPIHCYKPAMRERICQAMRYAGPRMIWYHPKAAIKHLIYEFLYNNLKK